MEETMSTLIPLKIAMDYPVNWDFSKILRDLIQNFYDSIGYKSFAKEFIYDWEENSNKKWNVTMKVQGHSFNYEWLTYIGASTKSNASGQYIGMYGEGFKICMLCLLKRNLAYAVMESENWRISPTKYTETVDAAPIEMLGYDMVEREDDGWTVLTLYDIDRGYLKEIEEALLDFYYPENPLFGEMLYEGTQYAIYKRSSMEIPCRAYINKPKGIFYCNYLARGRLYFDIIILCKTDMRKKDNRKREILPDEITQKMIIELFKEFDSRASFFMLEEMKAYWNDMPHGLIDMKTWYYGICQLVRNVCMDEVVANEFREKYTGLEYIERQGNSFEKNRLIEQTIQWYAEKKEKGTLVNPVFRLLGAKSLVEEFQEAKEEFYILPDILEKKCIELLFCAFKKVFSEELFQTCPTVKISREEHSSLYALVFLEREHGKKTKYKIQTIVMKHSDFERNSFKESFLKFCEAAILVFGKRRNATINNLFTHLGERLIIYGEELLEFSKQWDDIFIQVANVE